MISKRDRVNLLLRSEDNEVAVQHRADSIQVYLAHLDNFATSDCVEILDRSEIDAAHRMTSDASKNTFLRSRAVLRHVLSKQLRRSPASFRIGYGEGGKPLLPLIPNLHFNLSHSNDLALIGVSRCPIGIDVERIDETVPHLDLASHFFSARERNVIQTAKSTEHRAIQFFRIWTRKEAYLKGIGMGFSVDPSVYDVLDDKVVCLKRSCASPDSDWALLHLEMPSGYYGALAVKNVDGPIHIHSLKIPSELQIA